LLPGAPGLLATVVNGIITRRLGASIGAPGPRDFASAKLPFVRASKTRYGTLTAIAPYLACRDDRDTPLVPKQDEGNKA
jgi:hypothetical protein